MLCKKCNTENLLKADYCQSCGNKFSQEEKDAAYEKTIFGKFEKIENYISYLKPVELIKSNKFFRIGVLAVIIVYSIFISVTRGNYMRIEESNDYQLLYNKDLKAYYIISDYYNVNAQMHVPAKAEELTILNVTDDGTVVYSQTYDMDSSIYLSVSEDYHYVIQADCGNEVQSLSVYVVME